MATAAPRGRDVLVDGPLDPVIIRRLFASALGLPPEAVTSAQASEAERQASWAAKGRIDIHPVGPGSHFPYKLDIDLDTPIDVAVFPPLARRWRLTIAWCLDEAAQDDWRYHVAFPDGSVALRQIVWTSEGDHSVCVMSDSGYIPWRG